MRAYANLGYGIIDADQHWDGPDVPRDIFRSRVASSFQDRAPAWIDLDDGSEGISFNGGSRVVKLVQKGDTFGGLRKPAGTTVEERLTDMDIDGIQAAVLFTVEMPINQAYEGDREMVVELIKAYNDYKLEEVSRPSENRLFTLGMLPQTGVKDAVEEMQRCIGHGHKGVTLTQWPGGPEASDDDDYFWAAAAEAQVAVCIHAVNNFGGPEAIARSMHSRMIAERFPGLRIGLIELGAGWVPYFLQDSDRTWLVYRFSDGYRNWLSQQGRDPKNVANSVMTPSDSFHRLFRLSFMFDQLAVELRHRIGLGSLMWSTDYPHGGTAWPQSRIQFDHLFADLPPDDVKHLVHDNAKEFYHLDEVV
jgi:predicted TIM-barrel fold metal-dependent hydrolase